MSMYALSTRRLSILFLAAFPLGLSAAGLTFAGSQLPVLEEKPDRSTGLDKIYVCYDTAGVSLEYSVDTPERVRIYRYGNLGGGFAEEVTDVVRESGKVVLPEFQGNAGYIIELNDRREYYWIVDYLPYRLKLTGISVAPQQECDASLIQVEGSGEPIHYFTINGQQKVLPRDITVSYTTQQWDSASYTYNNIEVSKSFDHLSSTFRLTPPAYCSTYYHVEGDKFLRKWNWLEEVESVVSAPYAVASTTSALQDDQDSTSPAPTPGGEENDGGDPDAEGEKDSSNVIPTPDAGELGGSAPADIRFSAVSTEGVYHNEWQLSSDPEFTAPEYRFNVADLDYTFTQEGTYYLRYIGSNADGTCETISETYTVNIGASELLCPNAFSPDGDGVNDKWKVSYRSLLEFKCWIFDRYGEQLFYTEDPEEGWDGTRRGKPVKSGVYYYIIRAKGADGQNYKKSGDINILRHKMNENNANEQ